MEVEEELSDLNLAQLQERKGWFFASSRVIRVSKIVKFCYSKLKFTQKKFSFDPYRVTITLFFFLNLKISKKYDIKYIVRFFVD